VEEVVSLKETRGGSKDTVSKALGPQSGVRGERGKEKFKRDNLADEEKDSIGVRGGEIINRAAVMEKIKSFKQGESRTVTWEESRKMNARCAS